MFKARHNINILTPIPYLLKESTSDTIYAPMVFVRRLSFCIEGSQFHIFCFRNNLGEVFVKCVWKNFLSFNEEERLNSDNVIIVTAKYFGFEIQATSLLF